MSAIPDDKPQGLASRPGDGPSPQHALKPDLTRLIATGAQGLVQNSQDEFGVPHMTPADAVEIAALVHGLAESDWAARIFEAARTKSADALERMAHLLTRLQSRLERDEAATAKRTADIYAAAFGVNKPLP